MASSAQVVVVVGAPEAAAKIKAVSALLVAKMPLILTAGALPVMNKAKVLAPYKSGHLQRSIHIETVGPTGVTVGTNVVYAAAQEFGNPGGGFYGSDIPERPYLRPAMDTSTALVKISMQKALEALLAVAT